MAAIQQLKLPEICGVGVSAFGFYLLEDSSPGIALIWKPVEGRRTLEVMWLLAEFSLLRFLIWSYGSYFHC